MKLRNVPQLEYLEVVRQHTRFPNEELIDDVQHCLPSAHRMQRLRETMEAFVMDPELGRSGLLEIYTIAQAKAALSRPGFKVENWHYDRMSGMLLINLELGVHEHLSAALCRVYRGNTPRMLTEDAAEMFIDEGLGWFRSATSFGRPLKGKDVRLTYQEKTVFGTEFMLAD